MKRIALFCLVLLGMLTFASCGKEDEYDIYDDSPGEELDGNNDPADYDADGNYKPVDEMTDDEIEEELTGIMEDALDE